MSSRKQRRPRCPGCGLHLELCLCAERPELDLPTRFVFVQHRREREKPTNSARLAHRILRGSEIVCYGERDVAMDTGPLERPERDYYLLFPREDARTLSAADGRPEPGRETTIVVLDGTWHQCSRMARRAPKVDTLPCYALPEGNPAAGDDHPRERPRLPR